MSLQEWLGVGMIVLVPACVIVILLKRLVTLGELLIGKLYAPTATPGEAHEITHGILGGSSVARTGVGTVHFPPGLREQWLEQHGTEPTTTGGDKMMD